MGGALTIEQSKDMRVAAMSAASNMLALDPFRLGNRGPRRYSFGGASSTSSTVHLPAWAKLLDTAAMHEVLGHVFTDGYLSVGGGGDFVLPKTGTFQPLHRD